MKAVFCFLWVVQGFLYSCRFDFTISHPMCVKKECKPSDGLKHFCPEPYDSHHVSSGFIFQGHFVCGVFLHVCFCEHACVCTCMCMYAYVQMPEVSSSCHSSVALCSLFLRQGLSLAWELPVERGCLGSSHGNLPVSTSSVLRLQTLPPCPTHLFYDVFWGSN